MVMEDVPLLMQQNLVAVIAIVLMADDDIVHPTAWGDFSCMAIDGEAVYLVFPYASATHQHPHVDKLPYTKQQGCQHAHHTEEGQNVVPRP